jgi:hypothetical protein
LGSIVKKLNDPVLVVTRIISECKIGFITISVDINHLNRIDYIIDKIHAKKGRISSNLSNWL